ncbi:MAG TPA: hypothetical protein VHV83_02495, partial [Armatimonadota bacterium]|nr:hypothetical protein [Armatimonadota bacterium]
MSHAVSNQTTPTSQPVTSRRWLGVVFALLAVFLWGSNAVIARHLALEGVSMSVVAFLRVAVGSVVLGGWLA